ncbi:MAG: DUF559 domain-containing protein [Alphaproteobacteria bacterium]
MEASKNRIKSNTDYWHQKIEYNIERDKRNNELLKEQGWTVIRLWGCDIKKHTEECANMIIEAINKAKQ